MNRRTTYTLLALATTALAAIAAAASGGATAPVASTKPDLGKSLARLVRAAALPGNTSGAWSPSSTAL